MKPEDPTPKDEPALASVPERAAPDTRPILVFGGTFDPPHARHVSVVRGADALLRCKRVVIVPAWANPQRDRPSAPPKDRVAMCALAFQDLADATVSTVEVDAERPCYTVETLARLRAEQQAGALPAGPLRLLIGSDQALRFHTWRDWERVATMAEPAVVLRPPHERWAWEALLREQWDAAWTARWLAWTLPIDPVDVSSTEARRRLAAGETIEDLVPAGVAAYIRARGLYGARE
jgi:nicotinate-nucleotide adenylyltransferase